MKWGIHLHLFFLLISVLSSVLFHQLKVDQGTASMAGASTLLLLGAVLHSW
jgi:hypothetical protein